MNFVFKTTILNDCSHTIVDKERYTTYLQKYSYDCGAGAAGIVLLNLGGTRVNHDLLMESLEVTRNGTWQNKLERYFRRRGFYTESKEGATMTDLRRSLNDGMLPIVLYQGSGTKREMDRYKSGHYSVVAGIGTKYIYLLDPGVDKDHGDGIGWQVAEIPNFEERWRDRWKIKGKYFYSKKWMLSIGFK